MANEVQQPNMPPRLMVPFGALKDAQAKTIDNILKRIAEASKGPVAVTFFGQWHGRRFRFDNIHIANEYTPTPIRDVANGRLTLPILPASDHSTYVNTFCSFGMQVELAERKLRRGQFELVDGPDGLVHRLPKCHHIASCGYRGPWSDYVRDKSTTVTCKTCATKAVDGK